MKIFDISKKLIGTGLALALVFGLTSVLNASAISIDNVISAKKLPTHIVMNQDDEDGEQYNHDDDEHNNHDDDDEV
jgi:ABC-type Zn2+ transport system substrate-binding protein/surface adhesin